MFWIHLTLAGNLFSDEYSRGLYWIVFCKVVFNIIINEAKGGLLLNYVVFIKFVISKDIFLW